MVMLVVIFGVVVVVLLGDYVEVFLDVGLGFGRGVVCYYYEVVGEGDFGVVDVFVVGFEGGGVDFCVGVFVDVVEGWCFWVGWFLVFF